MTRIVDKYYCYVSIRVSTAVFTVYVRLLMKILQKLTGNYLKNGPTTVN